MFTARTAWKLAPNRLTQALEKRRGKPLLDLTVSNPTNIGLRYNAEAILGALANPAALGYRPEPKGMRAAREAVAGYYRERGDSVEAERLVLAASTSEAYSYVFRLLCEAGDEVAVPAPSYPLLEFLADLTDVRLKPYPHYYDHGWHVDEHALRRTLTPRTRAIVAVHPNNPTGSYLKPSEIEQLQAICREHELGLVADEVFLDFAHDGVARPSLARDGEALTFVLSGLSKIAGLPQMKFAWTAVSGPQELAGEALARLEVMADTYLTMNAPIQLAAPVFFEQRKSFQRELMERIRANVAELDRQLAGQKLCTRLEIEGGWYAVLRVPATRSDEELAIALLEQRDVLVHPGHFYEFAKDGYLVLSLIGPEQGFAEGVRRILGFEI